jgi:hypothetical protein
MSQPKWKRELMVPPESRNEFLLGMATAGALLFGFGLTWMPSEPRLAVFFAVAALLALGFGLVILLRPEKISDDKLEKSWKLFAYGAIGLMGAIIISRAGNILG